MTQYDFYLINKSFEYKKEISLNELRDRIEQMASDCMFIKDKGERIFRHHSIYEVEILENKKLIDILCYQDYEEIGYDQFYFLQQIVDQCKDTNLENKDIIELLDAHDEKNISGLLCLHQIEGVNPNYCVYSENDWFKFHRHFLTIYTPDVVNFCEQVNPFFLNLYLNQDTIVPSMRTLHVSHKQIMKTIIHHLTAINDVFHNFFSQSNASGDSACDELEDYYRSHQVRIGASRDKNNCRDLEFSIKCKEKEEEKELYCDLHTKFYQYFEDKKPSFEAKGNRIYFHQPLEDFCNKKTIIAHIGKHLCV